MGIQDSSDVTTWAPVSFFMLRNLGGGVRPDLGIIIICTVISTVMFTVISTL